jgi:peptidoglycan/xylan/chitin deacetylase (PgdA/CDA1 family)
MLPNRDWWRWSMKVALASTISRACRLPLVSLRARASRRPLILGYHRVVEDFASAARTEMPSMLISTTMFERHLEWLGQQFRFVSLDEIGEHAAAGIPFDEPVVAITFDDGYEDVYQYAYPTLKRKGIPAAIFVVTDLIGQKHWQIHDQLYYLLARGFAEWDDPRRELLAILEDLHIAPAVFRPRGSTRSAVSAIAAILPSMSQSDVTRFMDAMGATVGNTRHDIPQAVTWSMLDQMRRSGFTIGSHTKSHVSLPMEPIETATEELTGSKCALERHFGEPVVHFAYPGGHFTPTVVDRVAGAGYQFGYTACPHGDPRHPAATMERLMLWEGSSIDAAGNFSPPVLSCQVHDLWPPARRCERIHHQ